MNTTDIKLGFIGFGNMGTAIAEGLIKAQAIAPKQIYACAKNFDKLKENATRLNINPCQDLNTVITNSDMIIIAVKPYMIEELLTPVKDSLTDKIIISIAANFPFARYETILAAGTHHLSTIPNTPVAINQGIFVCEATHSLTEHQLSLFTTIFSQLALIEFVTTAQLSVAGTIAGCGPAFASLFIEALADAGVMHGLSRDGAYRLASKMLIGTASLQLSTQKHPGVMKDAVCSPGGTTIIGVTTLERKAFRSAVIDAIDAIERS